MSNQTDGGGKPNKNKSKKPQGDKPKGKFNFYWIYGLIFLGIIGFYMLPFGGPEKLTMNGLKDLFEEGKVEKVVVLNNQQKAQIYLTKDAVESSDNDRIGKTITGQVNAGPHYSMSVNIHSIKEELDELQVNVPEDKKVIPDYDSSTDILAGILPYILLFGFVILIWMFFMRRMSSGVGGPGGQIFNIGKSKANLYDKNTKVNVTFNDVAGLEEAKEEVMEVVDFLKNPQKYTNLGGKIPKGVLLVGNPGTGKTLIAKAMAGEAQVPFFSISGSDFVEMFVGVGASRVRDLFKQAREKAPCIIFIDEIDAIGRSRGKSMMQGNDERENTLNQLLVEMDGFPSEKGVILVAATNRPDVLDSALLRPGRFDRTIAVDKPDLNGRKQIFSVHLKNLTLSEEINAEKLAEQTPGFVGADIANICNEAALIAARRNKKAIEMIDFHDAIDRTIGGLEKKNKLISKEEKKIIAYHEAGHAICGWFLEHADPLVKVTIVPRGVATLGYAQYLPKEEYITQTEQILDKMCMTMGGRAAEKIIFGKISTGAASDLNMVTKQAYGMCLYYGLNEKVGNVSFYEMMQQEYSFSRPYSDETALLIDTEARNLIEKQYERAQALLTEKRDILELIAQELLDKEVLYKEDLVRLAGPRLWPEKDIAEALLPKNDEDSPE